MATALSEVASVIRDVLHDPFAEVAEDTRFEDLAGWDSMDLVSIVVEVECRFDLQFELVEIDRLSTISELLRMINAKRALAAA